MVQAMKKMIVSIEAESLGGYAKSNDFEAGKLENDTTSDLVFMFIDTISGKLLADTENSYLIYYEVARMQCDDT